MQSQILHSNGKHLFFIVAEVADFHLSLSGKSSHEFLKVFGRHISFDRSSSAAGGIYNGRESYGWLHFRLHGLLTA